jgi:hypothetical protein
LQTFFVDRVISASKRDYTRPRDAEPICLGTELLEKSYVFFVAVEGVACNVSVGPVGDFTWLAAELIPDTRSTSAFFSTALNLVADKIVRL